MRKLFGISLALAAALFAGGSAAHAAELTMPKLHATRIVHIHRVHVVRRPLVHYGYYWGEWGWRSGGTRRSWYGSTFALGARPGWDATRVVLAASPRGVATIDCTGARPDVCLAEPVIVPTAVEGRTWR